MKLLHNLVQVWKTENEATCQGQQITWQIMCFKGDNTHYKSQAQTQQLTVYWINFKI